MRTQKSSKAIEILSRNELTLVKGGEERDYIIVIVDGKKVKIYL
ncbi:hypothetical protein [Ancylomarina longa]|nr:hypothetical protein [Ancylomarina longa]